MLFAIGSRTPHDEVVELLLACHHRIREHLALARRIALAPRNTSAENIRSAAARIHAYFSVAFPMHRLDEEQDVFPRLVGHDDDVDRAITELTLDHGEHETRVDRVVAICAELMRDPSSLPAHGGALGESVRILEDELAAHLALEERTVFPALAQMSQPQRASVLAQMRARRAGARELAALT